MASPSCAGCCQLEDCPCSKACTEERFCDRHEEEIHRQWANYFKAYGVHARLSVMSDGELAAEMAAARGLK